MIPPNLFSTPNACAECGAAVYDEDEEVHAEWHAAIKKVLSSIKPVRTRTRAKAGS